jgi:hypothetical protein
MLQLQLGQLVTLQAKLRPLRIIRVSQRVRVRHEQLLPLGLHIGIPVIRLLPLGLQRIIQVSQRVILQVIRLLRRGLQVIRLLPLGQRFMLHLNLRVDQHLWQPQLLGQRIGILL